MTITHATDPIRDTNVDNVGAAGTTKPGAAVTVTFSDGLRTLSKAASVSTSGTWSATGIDARSLANGPVLVTATAVTPTGTGQALRNVTKTSAVLAPSIRILDSYGYVGPAPDPSQTKIVMEVTNNGPQASNQVAVKVTDAAGTVVDLGSHALANGASKTLEVSAAGLVDGLVEATAAIGQVSARATTVLDRVVPAVTIDPPGTLRWSTPLVSSMTFTGTATDQTSPIMVVLVTLKQGSTVVAQRHAVKSSNARSITWSANLGDMFYMPGNYTVEARALDHAGNMGPTQSASVLVL